MVFNCEKFCSSKKLGNIILCGQIFTIFVALPYAVIYSNKTKPNRVSSDMLTHSVKMTTYINANSLTFLGDSIMNNAFK